MKIEIDDEELEAMIEFQRSMRDEAEESLEDAERDHRQKRIHQLIALRHKVAA